MGAPARAADLFDDVGQVKAELQAPEASRRRDAVDKLDIYGAADAAPLLYAALGDPDLEVRVRAVASIGRHRLPDAAPKMLGLLNDPEPRLRASAAVALSQLPTGEPDTLRRWVAALERTLSDGEHEVRIAAVEALGKLPIEAVKPALPSLAARLDDENITVRERACVVLARLGDARATIPLLGRLADGSREVRRAAVDALGQLGDERAAPAVLRLTGEDQPEEVRSQAVQTLGRLRNRVAVPALVRLMERGSEGLRGRAAFALGRIAGAVPVEHDPAVAALVRGLGQDEARTAVREALRGVGSAAVPALLERVDGASGDELRALVELLGQLGDSRATPALLGELARGRLAQEPLADALGAIARGPSNDRRAEPELVALLASKTPSVRRHAMAALAGVADARAASSLGAAVDDPDEAVRLGAIAELGRLKPPSAVPSLIRALAGSNDRAGAAAAHALGEMADARALQPLLTAVEKGGPRTRRDAADALGRLPDARAQLPALLRVVHEVSADRRPDAIAAVAAAGRGHADPVARELLLGYTDSQDPAIAQEAVDALAALKDAGALPRLRRLLEKTGDAGLRRRLTAALAELGADPKLIAARLDDADPRVRAEAAWALGKRGKDALPFLPALERALAAREAPVRANALAALVRLGKPVARLASDGDFAVHANAQLKKSQPGKDWIAAHLVDFDGAPLADAPYWLVLPDGLIKSGTADVRGNAREESVPAGACRFEFPDTAEKR